MPSLESMNGYCEAPCFAPLTFILGQGYTCPRCSAKGKEKKTMAGSHEVQKLEVHETLGDELRATVAEERKKHDDALTKRAERHWVAIQQLCREAARKMHTSALYQLKEGNTADNESLFTVLSEYAKKEKMELGRTGGIDQNGATGILDVELRWR